MQSAKDLSIKESMIPQFSKQNMNQVNEHFHVKDFKRIEVNYFSPYFGYSNAFDGMNPTKQKEYELFTKEESIKAQKIISQFYLDFKKDFHEKAKHLSFTLYEPKIYKDSTLESINKCFRYMNERIEDREKESILCIYLIDYELHRAISYQDHLPFVNYIIFNF